jgi:4-diphosphocytidyl-2-C-methyl-D-erythritol kinase
VTALRALAPGKVNLCLFVGRPRADGLHPLVSLVQSLSLADELTLAPAVGADADAVTCAGVEGPNLAGAALDRFRDATGWDAPPQRLEIVKSVPVAAGMGGGSADAAATLRLAAAAAGRRDEDLTDVAFALGADVPSQLRPGLVLMTGAGEEVTPLADLPPYGVLVLPHTEPLATADVYAAFDARGDGRAPEELDELRDRVEQAAGSGEDLPADLLVNDLAPAARALCPAIDERLAAAREAAADHVLVSASGPTVFGVFTGLEGAARASAAAAALAGEVPGAAAAVPVDASFADPEPAA